MLLNVERSKPARPYPRKSAVFGDRDGVNEAPEHELRLGAIARRIERIDLVGELHGVGVC